MNAPAIKVEGLSKCYRIYANPQDRLKQAILDRYRKVSPSTSAADYYREHWALRECNFELQPGEAVGILGRNGAGKSTLLQLITGVLEPTTGTIYTNGRITALLELGSGFNVEFTGRENVFLNAQIIGLSKEDTLERYDDIAGFADIGDFIDQPVKTYSSGMMMRLAFAVQTALTPSIFIVDEALSVGDIFFQAKCMRRLHEMRDKGTTILFVSHAPSTVREICTSAILLDGGQQIGIGSPSNIVHRYMDLVAREQATVNVDDKRAYEACTNKLIENNDEKESLDNLSSSEMSDALEGKKKFDRYSKENRTGNRKAEFVNVALLDERDSRSETFRFGENVTCKMVVRINANVANLWVGYKVRTVTGVDIIHADSSLYDMLSYEYEAGKTYILEWKFKMDLMHGNYVLGCAIGLPDPPVGVERIMEFVDLVNVAQTFAVAPRAEGMIGGTAVWDNKLSIKELC